VQHKKAIEELFQNGNVVSAICIALWKSHLSPLISGLAFYKGESSEIS